MNFKALAKIFTGMKTSKILIVGLGNEYCSDDKAGLLLFEKLRNRPELLGANFINVGCNPENHIIKMIELNPELIIFIDAVEKNENQVSIEIYRSGEIEDKNFSTHAYSIGFIEKFIKMHIKPKFLYIGINIKNSSPGITISQEVFNKINSFMYK